MGFVLFTALAGAVAGLTAFALMEPFAPTLFYDPRWGAWGSQFVALIGALVGCTLGAVQGKAQGSAAHTWRGMAFGLVLGALGAGLGALTFDLSSLALAPVIQALRGGDEVGTTGRAITAVTIGGGVGLFTSLIIRATRTAWVRRIYGRNEYREWIVDAAQTTIGRSELAHIPILDDPAVAPQHAVIQLHGGTYYLSDCGAPGGTYVNGTPIRQVPLFSGALIQVGSTRLEFVMREGSAPARAAEALRQQWQTQVQTPAGTQPVAMATAGGPQIAGQPTVAMPQTTSQPTIAAPAPPLTTGVLLVALGGPMAGQKIPISGRTEVGRDLPALPLSADPMASRRHALLEPTPAGLSVTDLGSTNGTFVNGQRVSQALAKIGDVLRFGGTDFRVERA